MASDPDPDSAARRLASEALAADDPTGWFERLYAQARDGEAVVPWDRGGPHPLLVQWAEDRGLDGTGLRAIVVGFGLGHDAEYIVGLGFSTVAFDISDTAVRAARRRFAESSVEYLAANLLDPPAAWHEGFDLVVRGVICRQ